MKLSNVILNNLNESVQPIKESSYTNVYDFVKANGGDMDVPDGTIDGVVCVVIPDSQDNWYDKAVTSAYKRVPMLDDGCADWYKFVKRYYNSFFKDEFYGSPEDIIEDDTLNNMFAGGCSEEFYKRMEIALTGTSIDDEVKDMKESVGSDKSTEVANFIKDSVEKLQTTDYTNCKYNLDDKLAIYVGWSDGYDAEETSDLEIHSKKNPTYAINAVIGVRNDADYADLDYITIPYYETNGEAYNCQYTVSPKEDYTYLADSLLKAYEDIKSKLESGELLTESEDVDLNSEDLTTGFVNVDIGEGNDAIHFMYNKDTQEVIYTKGYAAGRVHKKTTYSELPHEEFPYTTEGIIKAYIDTKLNTINESTSLASEDRKFDIAFNKFLKGINGKKLDEPVFRAHGWYYGKFEVNGKRETFFMHVSGPEFDACINGKDVSKSRTGYFKTVDELIKAYNESLNKSMLESANSDVNAIEETEDYKLIKVELSSDGDMSQECIEYIDNEGKNLGTVSYTIYENGEYHIYTIEVRDDQRRKGIATILMKALQREVGDNDIYFDTLTPSGKALLDKIADYDVYEEGKLKANKYKGRIKNEDVAIDNDSDLDTDQVQADVDYWTDVDEANTEDVTDMKPIGVYTVSNNSAIYVYQIEYDIEDRILVGDSSDKTKAKWRDIIYGDGEAYFWYGDIKVPFNDVVRTDI